MSNTSHIATPPEPGAIYQVVGSTGQIVFTCYSREEADGYTRLHPAYRIKMFVEVDPYETSYAFRCACSGDGKRVCLYHKTTPEAANNQVSAPGHDSRSNETDEEPQDHPEPRSEFERDYLETNPNQCPYCKSKDIEGRSIEINGRNATQDISCTNCGALWTDFYTLSSMELVETGSCDHTDILICQALGHARRIDADPS